MENWHRYNSVERRSSTQRRRDAESAEIGGKRGFFYETWANGGPEWERFRAPATECARFRTGLLEEERATMGERWFRQEYLCEFEDTLSGVFARELVEGAITDEIKPLVIW